MLSLRLEKSMEDELERKSRTLGISKSEFVRICIQKVLGTPEETNAWELGKDTFGKFSSGRGDLSQNKRKTVSAKIRAKLKAEK